MAKILEHYVFSKPSSRYPWDEWFDGRVRKLLSGEDFMCKVSTLKTSAYRAAARRKRLCHIDVIPDGVILQAYEPTEEL